MPPVVNSGGVGGLARIIPKSASGSEGKGALGAGFSSGWRVVVEPKALCLGDELIEDATALLFFFLCQWFWLTHYRTPLARITYSAWLGLRAPFIREQSQVLRAVATGQVGEVPGREVNLATDGRLVVSHAHPVAADRSR